MVCSRRWAGQGLIAGLDLKLAAAQFAYLALGIAQDRSQFHPGQSPKPSDRAKFAKAAATTFLAAYGRLTG
jgi:hypothetical protein